MLQVLVLALILLMGIMPLLLSIWVLHRWARYRQGYRNRHTARDYQSSAIYRSNLSTLMLFDPEYFIGDTSCQFNAHSPLLRCAVNPDGPCQSCPHYESVTVLKISEPVSG